MKHIWSAVLVLSPPALCFITVARCQTPRDRYAPLNGFAAGFEFSNDSSHIILGQAFNRRLAGIDATYSRRVGRTRAVAYDWDIEARPLVLLQDPVATTTATLTLYGVPIGRLDASDIPLQRRCQSASFSGSFPVTTPGGPGTETVSLDQRCGARWTYAAGLSPVGQRLSFLPRHPWQPFLLANGGFLVSTRDEPVNDSSRFNFTFTFGTGVTWFLPQGGAWSVDYRVQHMSNKKIGDNNPGVDSQVVRVSYTVASLHRRRR